MSGNDLADRLSIEHQHPSPSGKIGLCQCPQCPDLRAAAALLREQAEQLDALRNAIGDPNRLRQTARMTTGYSRAGGLHLFRIADAVDASAAAGGGVPEEGATDE